MSSGSSTGAPGERGIVTREPNWSRNVRDRSTTTTTDSVVTDVCDRVGFAEELGRIVQKWSVSLHYWATYSLTSIPLLRPKVLHPSAGKFWSILPHLCGVTFTKWTILSMKIVHYANVDLPVGSTPGWNNNRKYLSRSLTVCMSVGLPSCRPVNIRPWKLGQLLFKPPLY